MDRRGQNDGTSSLSQAQRFELEQLENWLKLEIEGFEGPLKVERFNGGHSNPTYRLTTPKRTYVLRRKPSGPLLLGAHAVDRECRVTRALHSAGFPVPRPLADCVDPGVIGGEFYVMEFVEGRIFWDAGFPGVGWEERPLYFDAMNKTIARLHELNPEALGLIGYGKSGNYFERQIARWSKQYFADEEEAGRLPAMERLIDWLHGHLPAQEEKDRIIHGDFRCDNMIFHPSDPQVIAVLDWELSTLGQPLGDFAYHLMMYRLPENMIAGLAGLDLARLNIPDERSYVAAYCARTGREDIQNLNFFVAFGMFRLAAIIHGIKARLARGTASSRHAGSMTQLLEPLLEIALVQIRTGDSA